MDFRDERNVANDCRARPACPVAPACCSEGPAPCVEVWNAHDEKLRLCEALEELADDLPSCSDRLKYLQVASELVPLLRASHRYEEEVVFPAFERNGTNSAASSATVRRLKAEHVEDECAAQDITDVLLDVGRGGAVENPEALGFMLRAFFEGQRRHIAFEREHMLPIAAGLNLLDPSAPFLSLLREAGGALRDGQPSAQTGMADDSPVNGKRRTREH